MNVNDSIIFELWDEDSMIIGDKDDLIGMIRNE
jgi:hypothetical protein